MLHFMRNLFARNKKSRGFTFSRPLVLLQSDDWGRVGVRDREGFELLRSRGLRLGENPYDLYSLETAEDVFAVSSLLKMHRDSTGRRPCMVMNFCTANLDFKRMRDQQYGQVYFKVLAKGLPGRWSRPGLLEAYRRGIEEGVFYPALHGVSHFCPVAIENALARGGERAQLLRLLWEAETPYIFWRMPWIGYEYWNPEQKHGDFLSVEHQRTLIKQGAANFNELFGRRAHSACAPGYRSNRDTCRIWSEQGIRVAENGTGSGLQAPYFDSSQVLHISRSIDFEPCHHELQTEKYLEIAGMCFAQGIPAVISVHSINFHSTLKDYGSNSIAALDRLLTALECRYPDILYVHDEDLYRMVAEGVFPDRRVKVAVSMTQQAHKAVAAGYGVR